MAEVPGERSAPLRQLELGNALRRHREAANLTLEQVAEAVGFSASKISRIETADRHAKSDDLERILDLYNVEGSERARLTNLLAESKHRGWWEKFDLTYATYVGLEATAITIQDYRTSTIPSLLQTADYARAIARGHHPYASSRVIEQRVEAKMIRQKILNRREGSSYQVVMDEAALRRTIGSEKTMGGQLAHLAAAVERRSVQLQVITFERGWHPGMDMQFVVLSFAEAVGDVVHLDTPHGEEFRKNPKELELYRGIFAQLTTTALDLRESLQFLRRLAER